jgi:hypothetical protein
VPDLGAARKLTAIAPLLADNKIVLPRVTMWQLAPPGKVAQRTIRRRQLRP